MNQSSKDFFKEQVKKSFASCRNDITQIQESQCELLQVIEELKNQNRSKEEQLQQIQLLITQLLTTQNSLLQDIKDLKNKEISGTYLNKNKSLNVNNSYEPSTSLSNINSSKDSKINTKSNTVREQKDPYEALLEFKAKVNKKDSIKQKILTTIPNEGINSSELCFLFVEHFKYCSKATFYNYIKELEFSGQIRTQREQSKNIIYLQGTMNIPEKKLQSYV